MIIQWSSNSFYTIAALAIEFKEYSISPVLMSFFMQLRFNCLLTAAAAKSLQSCLTLCNSIDGSLPGSHIPGFSRQEHWSGLPFPSPMHESEG